MHLTLVWDIFKKMTIVNQFLHQMNIKDKLKEFSLISILIITDRTQNSFSVGQRPLPFG